MRSVLEESKPDEAALVTRKLRLVWKHPETRRYHQIGQFEGLADGRYAFGYVPGANEVDGFAPLVQFPDFQRVYISGTVPAFFANRIMSRQRPTYDHYLSWLGLPADAPPIEILARTGGPRATDTFHLVDSFEPVNGICEGAFFVSGVRHQKFDIACLEPGQELRMADDSHNEHNPRAILLAADGSLLGWVPDWLVNDIHSLREAGSEVRIFVDQINGDAPSHLSVLCRLVADAN